VLSPADGAPVTYVDIETTSLDERHRRPWEIAIIRHHQGTETEHVFLIDDVDLTHAVDRALTVGAFHDRHPRANPAAPLNGSLLCTEAEAAAAVVELTRDARWVGIVPDFDAQTTAAMLRRHGLEAAWHYQLVDAAVWAAGRTGSFPPLNSWETSRAYGLEASAYRVHTALDDARWARDLLHTAHATTRPREHT
jgi:hypothetical protein